MYAQYATPKCNVARVRVCKHAAMTTTGARRLELSVALCKSFVELTFVWAADALCLALVEKLLQEGRVLHCLGQKCHHLLLALLCGLQTAQQPLCLLLGILEREID